MKPILIDTDCGIDDAVAIMMALASPEVEVRGITTLAGNVDLPDVMNNVTRLLSWFGREDIPVYRGASTALVEKRPARTGHPREKRLRGHRASPLRNHAAEADAPQGMYETARANPGMTFRHPRPPHNLAMAINLHPDLVEHRFRKRSLWEWSDRSRQRDQIRGIQLRSRSRIGPVRPRFADEAVHRARTWCLALFFSEEDLLSPASMTPRGENSSLISRRCPSRT